MQSEVSEVEQLGKRIGFGRLMQLASEIWRGIDPQGALSVGPCFGMIDDRAPEASKPAPEALQRLIDFAHAAMDKREDYPDEYIVLKSRNILTGGHAPLSAKDLREVQKLGKPSWETDAATTKFFNDRHDARVDAGNQPLM